MSIVIRASIVYPVNDFDYTGSVESIGPPNCRHESCAELKAQIQLGRHLPLRGEVSNMPVRGKALSVALAFLLILSGCASEPPGGEPQSLNENCGVELPEPPQNLTNDTAVTFAEEYQRSLTYNQICSKEEYGLDDTTASSAVSLEFSTSDAKYIFAQQAFSYSTGQATADGAYSSVYRVSEGTFSRVQHYGAEQRPVETYSGPPTADSFDRPLEFRLYNFANESRSASINLYYRNNSELAFHDRVDLDGTKGIQLTKVANRSGKYSLLVTSESEQSRYEFNLADKTNNTVAIYIPPQGQPVIGRVPEYQ